MTSRSAPPSAADVRRVSQELGEDIIFGRVLPGTRLVEDPLMARFGATRHGVRQALAELDRIGLVVREPNKGARVRTLSTADVAQIYEVRELLQRQAVLRIALPAPDELVRTLQALHAEHVRLSELGDWGGVHRVNDDFHLTLFAACGNPYLVDSIRHYMWLSLPVRAQHTAAEGHSQAAANDHLEMIRLLAGRDSQRLADLCVAHLQAAKRDYLRPRLTSAGAPAA